MVLTVLLPLMRRVGWLEFNVAFQHKYGYIRDESADQIAMAQWIVLAAVRQR